MMAHSTPQQASKLVLLVEDDSDSAEMMTFVLEDAGYRVRWAANGEEALEALGSDADFDIVILDLTLPDMDGVEMAQRLGRLGRSVPPIIVASARSTSAVEEAARAIGARAIARKPFTIDGLLGTMQHVLTEDRG